MYIYMCILSQKGAALGNKYISEFLYLNSKATGTSSWNEFELDCFFKKAHMEVFI